VNGYLECFELLDWMKIPEAEKYNDLMDDWNVATDKYLDLS
jgi:hypothetical protein